MKPITGILNRNLVWELSNRFKWVAIHPMGLDVLNTKQKVYALQLNRNYVVTLKGIMTIKDFSFIWASGDYSPTELFKLPNVYSPVVDRIQGMSWIIEANKQQREVKIVYDPYEELFHILVKPGTYSSKLHTKLTDLELSYKLEDMDMLIKCLAYLDLTPKGD